MILGRTFKDIGIGCINPQHIINPYDGKSYTVPCGHCAACLNRKRSSIIQRIETLRHNSAVTFFVTLTYSPSFLPMAHFESGHCEVSLYSVLHKAWYDLDVVAPYFGNMSKLDNLLLARGSVDTRGHKLGAYNFGVLVKQDLQLFFKRFRRYFNVIFSQNIEFRYFAVGEYGCKAFRPHFHAIISFRNSVDYSTVYRACRYAWKLGNPTLQTVKSSAASYCASYINSLGVVPSFLSTREFKPFRVMSNKGIYELWNDTVKTFVKTSLFNLPFVWLKPSKDGGLASPLSRSIRLFFYPQCTGFYSLSNRALCECYSCFAKAVKRQRTIDPKFVVPIHRDGSICHEEYSFSELNKFRLVRGSFKPYIDNRVYHDLFISRKVYMFWLHFLTGICDFKKYVYEIIAFYKGRSKSELDILKGYYNPVSDLNHELPNSNFQLSLLRYQYSVMEKNVDDVSDLRLYYEYNYNYAYKSSNKGAGYYPHSFQFSKFTNELQDMYLNAFLPFDESLEFIDFESFDISEDLRYIEDLANLQSDLVIKHKEKNTYNNLKKYNPQLAYEFFSSKDTQNQ